MKNLKLISKLQPSEMVTLYLEAHAGEQLQYFIVSRSINYSIIALGTCEGSISGSSRTFNILLSSLYPLIDKGMKFTIKYVDDVLSFVSEDERVTLTPLCVEFYDPGVKKVVDKIQRFNIARSSDIDAGKRLAVVESQLRALQQQYDGLSLMNLQGAMTSGSPFGEVSSPPRLQDLEEEMKEKRKQLSTLKAQTGSIKSIDLKPFRPLALAAARSHELINFCESYAVLALKNTYFLQKGTCPVMAVQGPLLNQLMAFSDNEGFFWFENGLVYSAGDEEQTVVFMEKYLPNTPVDGSIVTRGVTLEQYDVDMKDILTLTQLMRSKFPQITLNMGTSKMVLENDKGEQIVSTFKVLNMDSVQLRQVMSGKREPGNMSPALITIPKEVQSLLSLFKGEIKIFVKERKIVFQAGSSYLVFGR